MKDMPILEDMDSVGEMLRAWCDAEEEWKEGGSDAAYTKYEQISWRVCEFLAEGTEGSEGGCLSRCRGRSDKKKDILSKEAEEEQCVGLIKAVLRAQKHCRGCFGVMVEGAKVLASLGMIDRYKELIVANGAIDIMIVSITVLVDAPEFVTLAMRVVCLVAIHAEFRGTVATSGSIAAASSAMLHHQYDLALQLAGVKLLHVLCYAPEETPEAKALLLDGGVAVGVATQALGRFPNHSEVAVHGCGLLYFLSADLEDCLSPKDSPVSCDDVLRAVLPVLAANASLPEEAEVIVSCAGIIAALTVECREDTCTDRLVAAAEAGLSLECLQGCFSICVEKGEASLFLPLPLPQQRSPLPLLCHCSPPLITVASPISHAAAHPLCFAYLLLLAASFSRCGCSGESDALSDLAAVLAQLLEQKQCRTVALAGATSDGASRASFEAVSEMSGVLRECLGGVSGAEELAESLELFGEEICQKAGVE
ncbi:unnamed protein product, partial [Chrysoparadoxa australica]